MALVGAARLERPKVLLRGRQMDTAGCVVLTVAARGSYWTVNTSTGWSN
jgi:hypothetical protein